jgi:hypothetical protein
VGTTRCGAQHSFLPVPMSVTLQAGPSTVTSAYAYNAAVSRRSSVEFWLGVFAPRIGKPLYPLTGQLRINREALARKR